MKIISNQPFGNGIQLAILEIDEPVIQRTFENRFQIMFEAIGNKYIPKDKKKFLNFTGKDYLYILKTETNVHIQTTPEIYYEKKICDKTWDECREMLMYYIGCYNNGDNLFKEIHKNFVKIN